jgi:hypothetical protein
MPWMTLATSLHFVIPTKSMTAMCCSYWNMIMLRLVERARIFLKEAFDDVAFAAERETAIAFD